MSASREKKIRQDLAAQGVTDPKKIREAEEKAKARKNNILYGVIAGVFVIVAAVLLVYNSGVLQRSATAVTINGEKYTAGQVEYFYANVKSSLVKSSYASFYGIDTSKSLDQQVVSDTMKTALGIEDEGDVTWEQYVRDTAVKQLAMYVLTAQEAEANGMGADEHTQEELDATMEELNAAAKQNGYSTKTYLKLIYGKNMTVDTFKEMVQLGDVATHYQSHYAEELTYTVSDLETYYQGNKSSFNVASYESLYFKGTADSTKDHDGNTVEPTDEENAAAKEAASANANAALEAVRNGLLMEKAADNYDNGTYTDRPTGTYSGDAVTEWVFNEERQEGDLTLIESGDNYYVVLFHSRGRNDYNTVDVRHILFKVDTSDLDSKADDYQEKLDARKAEQKEAAEAALKKWEEGARTEDSFAELANELSADTGSNTKGGLYTEVYKGQMVTEFNDWCFDESRQPGDTGIVYNEGSYTGYHVIYFVGTDAPYWQVQVRNAMKNADYTQWNNALVKDITATEASGMKYLV